MKTIRLTTLTSLFLILVFSACKKDNDEKKKPTCRIITITPSPSGNAFNITYNSEGKISTISTGNDITTFAYSGNTVIGTTNTSGVFSSKKIITLNANGMATNVKTEFNSSGTNWSNDLYEYSGTELIKATSTSSTGGTPSVSTLTWSNGNPVSATTGTSVTTLDYFTNKPAQTGDYLDIAQLVVGYRIYKPKNAIKSLLNGTNINSFDYTFDSDGKITSLVATGATNTTYTYQYQCN